jgi:hypothetical protein
MDTTNPYQPPSSEPPDSREQKFAKRLLSLRNKPLTLTTLFRVQTKAQMVSYAYFGLAIAYFVWADLQPGTYLMVGILGGILLASFSMARVQKRLWPMQKKVLDWEKVERMAEGEALGGRSPDALD